MESLRETMHAYRGTASWAVWGSPHPTAPFTSRSDLGFPAEAHGLDAVLHGRVVAAALNPGDAAADWEATDAWQNFHGGARHQDHLLAEAFRGTPAWGCYLTDLHPSLIESDSSAVREPEAAVTAAVRSLVEQLRVIREQDPLVLAIGAKAFAGLTANLDVLRDGLGTEPLVVRIPHYSGANNGVHGGDPQRYRALVSECVDPTGRWAVAS